MPKWRRGEPIGTLASLDSIRAVDSDGNVSYTGWGFDQLRFVLGGALDFGQEIPFHDQVTIVNKALFARVTKKQIEDGTRVVAEFAITMNDGRGVSLHVLADGLVGFAKESVGLGARDLVPMPLERERFRSFCASTRAFIETLKTDAPPAGSATGVG